MSFQSTVNMNGTVGGVSFSKTLSRTHNGQIGQSVSVAAAKTGTLTTRTDNDTGVATMTTGHGFATSDLLSVYWSGGMRRNMVATVAGDSVTIDGGQGDNLPIATTALTVMEEVVIDADVVGDLVNIIAFASDRRCCVQLMAGSTPELAMVLPANEPYIWALGGGSANPIAGDTITSIRVSHDDSAAAHTIDIGIGYASG